MRCLRLAAQKREGVPLELTTVELLDVLEKRLAALRDEALAEKHTPVLAAARNGSGGHSSISRSEPSKPAKTPDVNWSFPATKTNAVTPENLRIRMQLAGLDPAGLATVFGIPPEMVRQWLRGDSAVPDWVLPCVRMFELLTPMVRRRLMKSPATRAGRTGGNSHPFSRIEEL